MEKLLHEVNNDPFLGAINAGYTQDDIKDFILSSLHPYFENSEVLNKLAINVLAPEAINLLKLKIEPNSLELFEFVLALYKKAKTINKTESFNICAQSESSIGNAMSHYWSCFYLEVPKPDLSIHEYAHEIFRTIGVIVEACLQPFLRDLLQQLRLVRDKKYEPLEIYSLSLGNVVDELYETIGEKNLMAPSPWRIKINQWRNIAQHHKFIIRENIIIATYGASKNEKVVHLTRQDLMAVLNKIMSIFRAIKLARTIYVVDNTKEIDFPINSFEIRNEAKIMNFLSAVATQGFQIKKIDINENEVFAKIINLLPSSNERLIHASQLLLPLSRIAATNTISIEYWCEDTIHAANFSVTSNVCEQLDRGAITIEEYINHVKFDMNVSFVIPVR